MIVFPLIRVITAILLGGAAVAVGVGIAGLVYDWVQKRITKETVRGHYAEKIKKLLDNGDYETVNVGLTANVIDVSQKDGVTYVAYEVDGKRYGIRSHDGTTLSENERLTLRL